MIRPATEADAPTVAALVNALNSLDGPPQGPPMTAETVRRDLLGPAPRAWLRVAEHGGRVMGFATATPIYDAALAAEALRRGAACLWWGVDEGGAEAVLFYRAIGAVSEGRFSSEILEGAALARLAAETP